MNHQSVYNSLYSLDAYGIVYPTTEASINLATQER